MSLLNGLSSLGVGLNAFADAASKDEETRVRAPLLSSAAPAVAATATDPAQAATVPATDTPAPGTPAALIAKAIYGQESGSGANTATSPTGARGGMQIQPETFRQYARPGESIDNPAHNMAVGQRIIDDLWQKSGGDPARVAVGYFSGPGNIAPPDSPTPWVRNAADPTGKTVSSYVGDVLKRIDGMKANS